MDCEASSQGMKVSHCALAEFDIGDCVRRKILREGFSACASILWMHALHAASR